MVNFLKKNSFVASLSFFYLCLLLVFNNVSLFLAVGFFALLLALSKKIKTIEEVLWLTLLASFPFDIGKGFAFNLVSPTPDRETGYRVWLVFSPSLILAILLLLKLIFIRKKPALAVRKSDFFWWLLALSALGSCLPAASAAAAFFGWLELIKSLVIYFAARYFLKNRRIFERSLMIVFSWLFFEGLIAFWQFAKKGPVGFYLEEGLVSLPLGVTTPQIFRLFRSYGTFYAPNRLAAFLFIGLLLISAGWFKKTIVKNSFFHLLVYLAGFLGLVLSFSRTSWLIYGLIFSLSSRCLLKKGYHLTAHAKRFSAAAAFFILALAPFLFLRLKSLATAFGYYGAGSVRMMLAKEALNLIFRYPGGVGFNHFTRSLVLNAVTPVSSFFLQPVHNIYLLLAAEAGILSLFFFLLALIKTIYPFFKKPLNLNPSVYPLFVFARGAVLGFLIIGFFEPFFIQPVFDFFMLTLGMLEAISET
ncbi:MAG: hypothetical protein JW991_00075 [Candidatus Pacebacteria bacterium]|nr:hypothetical protein [Candidatus Paceibacterota bacterium]